MKMEHVRSLLTCLAQGKMVDGGRFGFPEGVRFKPDADGRRCTAICDLGGGIYTAPTIPAYPSVALAYWREGGEIIARFECSELGLAFYFKAIVACLRGVEVPG